MIPRFALGFSVLYWGLQADLIWFAIPMAVILEARHFIDIRWALTRKDFYRVADLTSVALLGIVIFLFLNARNYHFILTLLRLLPLLFAPLVIVLAYSTTSRMPLDVLFHSLRRQKEPVQQSWDMDYLLLGLCLIGAGTNTDGQLLYFPVVVLIALWTLYPLRSHRYPLRIWILVVVLTILAASLTHQSLRAAHLGLKSITDRWIANWILQRTDPLHTRTALGKVGRMKLSDAILFRLQGSGKVPKLLVEASYDDPGDTDSLSWSVWDPSFSKVPHADDFTWRFHEPVPSEEVVRVYLEFDRDHALVPVPSGLSELQDLPALEVLKNPYGAVQGSGLVPSPSFKMRYSSKNTLFSTPDIIDTYLPAEYENLLSGIIEKGSYPPGKAVEFVRNFFSDFRYSLYQNEYASMNPLAHFLYERKAGHCEYFATATTLLLRQMGIPARYVVGYSVQEYNESIDMYIVRQRHAHAWAIAFINDSWQVIDTTPGVWAQMEDENASPVQPLLDFVENHIFVFQLWWNDQKLEDYELELYLAGGILVLILIWRITRSEQVTLSRQNQEEEAVGFAGSESPFFRICSYLEEAGWKREPGELLRRWLIRIQKPELLPMLGIHNRCRFDPNGASVADRRALSLQVDAWLESQTENRNQGTLA